MVAAEGRAVTITVKAAKNLAVTVLMSLWSCAVIAMYVAVLVGFAGHALKLPWLLAPTVFAGAMVAFSGSLLRCNIKGHERMTIRDSEVRVERKYFPSGNGEMIHEGDAAFALWRPYQRKGAPLDYEFWGVGPWSLGLAAMSGKKSGLLNRLTKGEARAAGEALRRAGYAVDGLEQSV